MKKISKLCLHISDIIFTVKIVSKNNSRVKIAVMFIGNGYCQAVVTPCLSHSAKF